MTTRRLALFAAALLPLTASAASPLAIPPVEWSRLEAGRSARVARAERHFLTERTALGLGPADALSAVSSFTDEGGRTVVRLVHRHAGRRVLGSEAIVHVEPDGRLRTLSRGLAAGIVLGGAPRLAPADAVAAALRHLGAHGPLAAAPEVEPVVFPTRLRARDAEGFDAVSGRPVANRGSYAAPARREAPYVWAYRVLTRVRNRIDGAVERAYVVHGDTGAILRVDDLLARITPAVGTGHGHHAGEVSLDTALMGDGTYALLDPTRGVLPNPNLQNYEDDGTGWTPSALQVWWEQHDAEGAATFVTFLYQGNPANGWGDGLPFTSFGDEGGPNGQTAGVDVLHGLRTTWDFYAKVFGRSGLDGNGTAVQGTAISNTTSDADNAFWSIGSHAAWFGAGTWPADPAGVDAVTSLDVVAHEATHGLTSPGWTQYWVNAPGYEEAGLNEATSDFFSEMVELWAARGAGAPDDVIPDEPGDAEIGRAVLRGAPLRRFDWPSFDGRSADGWYDGLAYLDGHFSAGPLNRALHYLARGAPAAASDPAHSVFLPGGMAGVGNDAAARIWFRVVTEYLLPAGLGEVTHADAREAALSAAADLYGATSAEATAVENAFAAIDVGEAHGAAPRVKVWFAPWRNGDYIEKSHFTDYSRIQNLPRGEAVRPRIAVENAADPRVTWSLGGPSMFNGAEYFVQAGGVLGADGRWTTPFQMGWHAITATSVADPGQRAEGRVFLVNLDHDSDLEQDATDMADLSFSWFLTNGLNPSHSVYIAPWVDDADVATFADAMKAAWPTP